MLLPIRLRHFVPATPVLAWPLLFLITLLCLVGPGLASAQAVGDPGLPGLDGGPSEAGGDGTDGGDAILPLPGDPPANIVTTQGGAGGNGGAGGAPDGAGGSGGNGGTANAEAVQTDAGLSNGLARATATGGAGGSGGASGGGDAPQGQAGDGGSAHSHAIAGGTLGATINSTATGGRGGFGDAGGIGGDATATAEVGPAGTSAFVTVNATARGGAGSSGSGGQGGRGGDASAEFEQLGVEANVLRVTLSSTGGNGATSGTGGAGGGAHSRGIASASGEVQLVATSGAGTEGSSSSAGTQGADGGEASSIAHATSTLDDASATAHATGGQGVSARGAGTRAGNGGVVDVEASATTLASGATSFARVTAVGGDGGHSLDGATAGDGASVALENAASATGENVALTQHANGGRAGRDLSPSVQGPPGRGGDATSLLDVINPNGDLTMDVRASGGNGEGSSSRGGDARAGANGQATGNVTVRVEAAAGVSSGAGQVGPIAETATAEIVAARGESTGGGAVTVEARLFAADGASGQDLASDGADAVLVDVAEGVTTGDVFLIQSAIAGDAGGSTGFITPVALGGAAGNAENRLDRSVSSASIRAWIDATAGHGGGERSLLATEGGRALSELTLANDAGTVEAEARALGGEGADSWRDGMHAAHGGEGRVVVHAQSEGDGSAITVGLRADSVAEGGRGGYAQRDGGVGGIGGLGTSDVRAEALGDSAVTIRATARGGLGGDGEAGDGNGGEAEAHAFGSNAGSSAVRVEAIAIGGFGGDSDPAFRAGAANGLGGNGGEARATAEGISTGGGSVTVSAEIQGGGASDGGIVPDSVLVDAVSGATTGTLRLEQEAIGAGSNDGSGADGRSSLTWIDDDGGSLEIVSIGRGGDGGRYGQVGVGGTGFAEASGTGRDDVSVLAHAVAGDTFRFSTEAADASLGTVYGESTGGGRVIVEAIVEAAPGSSAPTGGSGGAAGYGGEALLENAVDGATTGVLELRQRAVAGGAGGFGVGQLPGLGGAATSRLSHVQDGEGLVLRSEAIAGRGSDQRNEGPRPGIRLDATRGADAFAESVGTNVGGRIEASALATGGVGGVGARGGQGGDGGDATVRVRAETNAAEGDIEIGLAAGAYGAEAGEARVLPPYNNPGLPGLGGDATSDSVGQAFSEGRVIVRDRAIGGDGATGGNASSMARGSNAGSLAVNVFSLATAGLSNAEGGGASGSAEASSTANSLSGTVLAEARATGSAGRSTAMASTYLETEMGERFFVSGETEASVRQQAVTRVEIAEGPLFGFSRDAASVRASLSSTQETGFATLTLGLRADQIDALDITLRTEASLSGLPLESLEGWSATVNPGWTASASFDAVAFRLSQGGDTLIEQTFGTAAELNAFFATVFDLEALTSGLSVSTLDLRFELSMTGGERGSGGWLTFDIRRTIIPEPSTALLLGLGLACLSQRRRH